MGIIKVNISMKLVNELTIRSRTANELLGICPVCNCRDANFNTAKLVWRCWHGEHSGRITPEEGHVFKEIEEPVLDIPEIRKLYTLLASSYHDGITLQTVEYLKGRGLTQQTIDGFMLGFCSTGFIDAYTDKLAEVSGILYRNYPVLTNRITIPYVANGEVTDLRGRILNTVFAYKDNIPTYSSLSGSHKSRGATFLFNHDIIATNSSIILTEGEFKAVVGYQHGFPVVAMPGIYGWQKEWSSLFKDKELILAPDNDGFGGVKSPAYRMVKQLQPHVPNAKIAVLRLTNGHDKEDIDSMINGGGLKRFERAVAGAIGISEWMDSEERKGHGRKR